MIIESTTRDNNYLSTIQNISGQLFEQEQPHNYFTAAKLNGPEPEICLCRTLHQALSLGPAAKVQN